MKINRKYITILSIAVASVLTVSIILFFTDASDRSGRNHGMNDNLNGQSLIQVGSTYITHTNLTTYKNNLAHSTAPLPDDSALLKEMATKELMLQLADEQGVAASLEDGIQRAKELLKTNQPDAITSTQQLKDELLNTALNEQRIIVLNPDIQLR